MRHRAKVIVGLALMAALTVAGLSLAAGGGSGGDRDGRRGEMPHRHGPPPFLGGRGFDPDVAAVLGDIHKALAAKAPGIAGPVIQKAQDAGDISSDQADKLRAAAQALADGKDPHEAAQGLDLRDAGVRKVIRDALRAAAKQAPSIGEPIVAKAESDGKITAKQAARVRKQLKRFASLRRGGAPFFRGPHRHGPPPFLGGRGFDPDVAAVLGDIHKALAAKAPGIAGPVIQKAQDAGDISSDQADKLRAAAQALADGKDPHEAAQGLDLRDAGVRKVIRDALRAAAKQAPSIGEPIVAKAESDGKITAKQAARVRKQLKRFASARREGPPFLGPGHPGPRPFGGRRGPHMFFGGPPARGRGGHGRFDGRQGNAPGAFPGDAGPSAQPGPAPALI